MKLNKLNLVILVYILLPFFLMYLNNKGVMSITPLGILPTEGEGIFPVKSGSWILLIWGLPILFYLLFERDERDDSK